MIYTVAELSKMLEVSKVTIYNKLNSLKNDLKPYTKHKKGVIHIDDEGLLILKKDLGLIKVKSTLKSEEQFKGPNVDDNNGLSQFKDLNYLVKNLEKTLKTGQEEYINSLLDQIEILKLELQNKDAQINNTLRLLENSQILMREDKEKILMLESKDQKEKRSIFDLFKKKE